MLGQALLDRMEIIDQELQLQSGEANVTKGLIALNMAQDYFEALTALRPLGIGSTTGTFTTTINQEYSAFPTGLLRLDSLWMLNATTSRPDYKLERLQGSGMHSGASIWPLNIVTPATSTGKPTGYEFSGGVIWWDTLPDSSSYTLRWYGFQAAADITAGGTFTYPDVVALALPAFAVRLYKQGLDDSAADAAGLAQEFFKPTLDLMARPTRDGADALTYTRTHTT